LEFKVAASLGGVEGSVAIGVVPAFSFDTAEVSGSPVGSVISVAAAGGLCAAASTWAAGGVTTSTVTGSDLLQPASKNTPSATPAKNEGKKSESRMVIRQKETSMNLLAVKEHWTDANRTNKQQAGDLQLAQFKSATGNSV
jgi:hypothetical protein